MPGHDHRVVSARHLVGEVLEVDAQIGRTHSQFSHRSSMPDRSDIRRHAAEAAVGKKINFFS
jgi:hypothetical protein